MRGLTDALDALAACTQPSVADVHGVAFGGGFELVAGLAPLPVQAAITFERETVSMLYGTDDRVEGVAAFLEKRAPSFRGR